MIKRIIKLHKTDKESDKIKVSFLDEEKQQIEYKSSHIDRHEKYYERLPVYNIAGDDISSKSSLSG